MAQIDLDKLVPGKTYNIVVRAKDSEGNYSNNSVVYKFTVPIKTTSSAQLTSTNYAVVTALAPDSSSTVGGALVAGALDSNGIANSGSTNLGSVWNATFTTASGYPGLTGSVGGAVIINSTGILGYQFTSSAINGTSSGQANFFLDTSSGNAYFRGTVFATGGQFTGSVNAGTVVIGANIGGTTASGFYIDSNNYWVKYPSVAASFSLGGSNISNRITYDTNTSALVVNGLTIGRGGGNIASNTAIGITALSSNTTGYYNVAIGSSALYSNLAGWNNIAMGPSALYTNDNGWQNVAIGDHALFSAINTLGNDYGSNKNIAIGASSLYNVVGWNNIGIGVNTNSDGSGGYENIAIGTAALTSNNGYHNTALGNIAMVDNDNGTYNTAIGIAALASNTQGDSNIAIGPLALSSNLTGSRSIALGDSALYSSLKSFNVALGYYSLFYTTSSYNVSVGYNSGSAITTGSGNLVLGGNDGTSIKTLNNRIILSDGVGNISASFDSNGNEYVKGTITASGQPFLMSASTYSIASGTINSLSSSIYTITLPANRFSVAPIIVVTLNGAPGGTQWLVPRATGITTSSFSLGLYNPSSTTQTWSSALVVGWTAIQMISTSAGG